MSEYIVSARKYRPNTFSSVVGQENITHTLKNAIKKEQLAQAYLFAGPRGVGKTTTARIFAKTINCEHITEHTEACGECVSCKAFDDNASYNIHELDAASNNSVEDIRNLIEQVRIPPQIGRYKIYIIDEVHMLSQQAFNAFLKTLEEPPKHAIFILATTEKHKIIPTILSRCQIFDFARIKVPQMVKHLQDIAEREQVQYEEEALNIIAQKADGGLRDALSIFDKLVSFTEGNISYQAVLNNLNVLDYDYFFTLVTNFMTNDYANALRTLNEILDKGFSEQNFLGGLLHHFRDLLMLQNESTKDLLEVGEKIQQKYLEQAQVVDVQFLLKAMKIVNTYMLNLKTTLDKHLHTELAIVELSTLGTGSVDDDAFAKKHIELKKTSDSSANKTEVPKQQSETTSLPKEEKTELEKKENKQKITQNESQTITSEVKEEPAESLKSEVKPSLLGIPNIGETIKKKTDAQEKITKEEQKQEKNLSESFSQEQLLEVWSAYAGKYLNENERLKYLFENHKPQLQENFVLSLSLLNESQKTQLEEIYSELLSFLKINLKNTSLSLSINIVKKQHDDSDVPYTEEEKFEYLKKENPNIEKLRQQLDLDFE